MSEQNHFPRVIEESIETTGPEVGRMKNADDAYEIANELIEKGSLNPDTGDIIPRYRPDTINKAERAVLGAKVLEQFKSSMHSVPESRFEAIAKQAAETDNRWGEGRKKLLENGGILTDKVVGVMDAYDDLAKQGYQETLRRDAREIVAMLDTLDLSDRDEALAYLGELATNVLDKTGVDKAGVPQKVLDKYAEFGLEPLTDEAAKTLEQDTTEIEMRGDRAKAVEKAIEAILHELQRSGVSIHPGYVSSVTNWVYSRFSKKQKDAA